MKFISEQFARRKYLSCEIGGVEWWAALKKAVRESFIWMVDDVQCKKEQDITSIYWEVALHFPEAMWMKGTEKTAVESDTLNKLIDDKSTDFSCVVISHYPNPQSVSHRPK